MPTPTVSIVIPTYNRPDALCELLESLARQTCPDFEVIVVNDAGTNVGFVRTLYPELALQVLDMPENGKHVRARNRGLQQAAGEFVMLCDDDDLIVPDHLERMLGEIRDHDLVYSDVEIFDYVVRDGTRIATARRLFAYQHDLAGMRQFSTFVSSGCLYRRAIHDRIGTFDPAVYHYWDWDFFLRAAACLRVKRVPVASALYAFSAAGGNLSGEAQAEMRLYLDVLARKHGLGDLPVKNFFLLLEEPAVKARAAASTIVWDGRPVISRRARQIRQ